MTDITGLTEAQVLYYEDLSRLRGQRGRLMELLLDGAWHPNYECAEVGGLSFNDSIFASRKEGWIIESRKAAGGIWEFRLTGKGDPPQGHKAMSRPQRLVAAHYLHTIRRTLDGAAMRKVRAAVPEWMRTDPEEWEAPDPETYASELPGERSSSYKLGSDWPNKRAEGHTAPQRDH
jgi:hypothetical protein